MCDAGFVAAKTVEDDARDTRTTGGPQEDSGASDRAAEGRTGHWYGVEESQARHLISAMTGRTPEEVTEPLSRLLHELRYRPMYQESPGEPPEGDVCPECRHALVLHHGDLGHGAGCLIYGCHCRRATIE